MSNLAPYQSRGQIAAPEQHYSKPANLHYDNSGERALARANADMTAVLVKGYNDWKEQYDSGKVMEANNEYNRLMTEGTTELMQRKQENALNIVDDYDKLHQKALDKVRRKFGAFINYGKPGQAFNIYTERDNNTRRQQMMKYQLAETEAYHDTQFNNQLAECQNLAADGGYSDLSIEAGMNRANGFIDERYAKYGKEMIEQQKRVFQGQIVENALSLAVNMEDYARVEQLCAKYKDVIDPKKYPAFLGMVSKRRNEAKKITFNQQMFRDLPDNATDEQVREYVANHHKPKQRAGGGNTSREEGIRIMSIAIGEQESGGDYTATNSSGALGKYQIMDFNWPYWAQDAGLPADADWRVPENQEIVFRHKVGEYIDEYGVEGAIIAWYAGAANGARWRDGEPDAIGEGGRYSWDAPQYGPEGEEYTSVRGYLESVLALRENAGSGAAADAELDLVDLQKEQDDAVKAWHNHRNEIDASNNRIIKNYGERLKDLINHGEATTEAMQNLVDQAVLESGGSESVRIEMETKMLAETARQQKAIEQAAKGKPSAKVSDVDRNVITQKVAAGEYTDNEINDYCNHYGITSDEERNKLLRIYKDYMNNKGVFAIDYDSLYPYFDKLRTRYAKEKDFENAAQKVIREEYWLMLAENGGRLEDGWQAKLTKRIEDSSTKEITVGEYKDKESWIYKWTGASEKRTYSWLDLRLAGIRNYWKPGEADAYVIYNFNGEDEYLTGDELDKKIQAARAQYGTK